MARWDGEVGWRGGRVSWEGEVGWRGGMAMQGAGVLGVGIVEAGWGQLCSAI